MLSRVNRMLGVAIALVASFELAAETPPVQIRVYGEHSGDNLIYHYSVTNNSSRSFRVFVIGSKYDSTIGEPTEQLGSLPVGWRFGREGEVGTEIILDGGSTTQPPGWEPNAFGPGLYSLEWAIPMGDDRTTAIRPGETLEGFSVTVPGKTKKSVYPFAPNGTDEAYFKGGFEAGFSGQGYFGQLELIDVTPPSLKLAASPAVLWPPNGKPIEIAVSVNVQDDFDREPAVRLESITANEPLQEGDVLEAEFETDDRSFRLKPIRAGNGPGRTYVITYSATDAVGNKTTAQVEVEVPHDKGRGK